MKRKYKVLLIILAILVILIVTAVVAINILQTNFAKQISEVTIGNVDLTKIPDGTYDGSCRILPVEAVVKVTVENHRITSIELVKHVNGQGQAAEVLPGKVVDAQSLKVDVISGATYSSKVILKAIENALNSAAK